MALELGHVTAMRPRVAAVPAPPGPPPPALLADTGNAKVDAVADVVNSVASPFQNPPDPKKGVLGEVEHGIGAVMGVVGAPFQLLDTGFAMITAPLAAMMPAFPAATLLMPHLGTPHAHMHPPSLTPPNPVPVPLPSIGQVMLAGAVSVLIGGIPAARAGDVGLAPLCFSFSPAFDIWTGSSNTWIGGSRAARMLDITRHCNPASAMNAISKAMGAIGVVAGAVSAGASAAAGAGLQAAMQAAQAAADAASIAMSALLGKDPGIPPAMGAVMMGTPNVLIGGFPMPDTLELLGGMLKGLKMLGKAAGNSKAFGKLLNRVGLCNAPGEPINPFSGEVYNDLPDYAATDSGFVWGRHYRSGWNEQDGPLGHGFRHVYQRKLTLLRTRALYETHDGESMALEKRQDGSYAPSDGFALWTPDGQHFELHTDRDERLYFRLHATTPPSGRLERYASAAIDAYLFYDDRGRLRAVSEVSALLNIDTHFLYDTDGRIAEVRRGVRNQPALTIARYTYRDGCLVEHHDVLGAITRYRYDAARRMIQARAPSGYSFHWQYDAVSGRCTKSYGDDGLWSVEAAYAGSQSVFTEPDGGRWTFKHYPDGAISHIVDPLGGVMHYVQNANGRIVRQVTPGGATYEWLYDASGKHTGRRGPFGHLLPPEDEEPNPKPLAFDGPVSPKEFLCGRPLSRGNSALKSLPSSISSAIRSLQAHALPNGQQHFPSVRDVAGRVVSQYEPDGSLRTFAYDADGNIVGEHWGAPGAALAQAGTPSRLGWYTRQFGSWNLLFAETSPLGATTRYEYSHREKWRAVIDANGNRTDYVRDQRHRIHEIHRYGGLYRRYYYDASDALTEEQDGSGKTLVRYETGPAGLHSAATLSSGERYEYAYDANGQITRGSSSKHEVRQRHIGPRLTRDERDGKSIVHHYTPTLQLRRTIYFGRFVVRYARGRDNQLRISTPDGTTHGFWNDGHNLVRENGNGTNEVLGFDGEGRLATSIGFRASEPAQPIWSTAYRYNAAGELLYAVDGGHRVTSYGYDEDHRLVSQRDHHRDVHYAYDAAGNLTQTARHELLRYAADNLLVQADLDHFYYDERRRVAQRDRPDGNVTEYFYDSLDQLVEVRFAPSGAVWRAAYDGLGRRLWREYAGDRTEFFWDGDRLGAERFSDGRLRLYVYANEDALVPFSWIDYLGEDAAPETGKVSYLFTAPTGMPLRVEDQTGNAAWRAMGLDAYGELDEIGAPCPTRLRFAGHFFDEHLGLFYNRFRDYDPTLGRYLQPDPLGHAGGINLFAYPSNPVVQVDLRGLTIHPRGRRSEATDGQNGNRRGREGDERPEMLRVAEAEAARRGLVRRESPAGPEFPPGTRRVEYGDPTNATYHVDSKGRILRAEGELDPPTNYDKVGVDHVKPEGFVDGQDHRGHLIPERAALEQQNANVRENVIAEHGTESNTSLKKRFENRARKHAAKNPGCRMISEPAYDGDNPRPTEVTHTVVDRDGNVVTDPAMMPNPDTIANPNYS